MSPQPLLLRPMLTDPPNACCACPASTPVGRLQSFMYQLLKGVAHMHKHGVMHRDLKPQNLLVDDSVPHPLLKVADLGLGRHFTIPIKAYTHEVGAGGRGGDCRGEHLGWGRKQPLPHCAQLCGSML